MSVKGGTGSYLPRPYRVTSWTLGQWYGWTSVSEATLADSDGNGDDDVDDDDDDTMMNFPPFQSVTPAENITILTRFGLPII